MALLHDRRKGLTRKRTSRYGPSACDKPIKNWFEIRKCWLVLGSNNRGHRWCRGSVFRCWSVHQPW